MTSPSDDHAPQHLPDRSPQLCSNPSPKRPHVVKRSQQREESGFFVSGWGTAIFLLIGLSMMAGLFAGSYWLITEAEVITRPNTAGTFWSEQNAEEGPVHAQILPPKPLTIKSRRRASQIHPYFLPRVPPPETELTKEDQTRILDSLHPLEEDDKRSEDIRNGFSLENIIASQNDPSECRKMTEVIRSTFGVQGQQVSLLTDQFFYPTLHWRIRELLPPEILARSKLEFELKYMARVYPQVRVVHLERYNDDTERTAYCLVGEHSEYAFRYELFLDKLYWNVVDIESIDTGLSLSEIVAMSETLNVLFPNEHGQLYANAINLFNPDRQGDIQAQAASYRKYLMEKVPDPLRDFYLSVTAGAGDQFWKISPKAVEWVRDVEDLDRFISVHRLRMDFARNERNLHDVVTHAERYMARAGYASHHVVRSYVEALIQLDRVQDSLKPLEYLLTLDRKDEATIQMLATLTAAPEVRKQLAPLLEEFELNELLIVPEPEAPNSSATTEREPESEPETPAPSS